jgi:hypothetical protein
MQREKYYSIVTNAKGEEREIYTPNKELLRSMAKLSGEAGVEVLSIGLNMKFKKVITKSKLIYEGGEYTLINGGCRCIVSDVTFEDMYLDTKENRKILKDQINKYYETHFKPS